MDLETQGFVRAAAFAYVEEITADGEQPITWQQLQSFAFSGQIVPLASQQGIFKPKLLDLPISIRTTPPQEGVDPPYQDEVSPDGFLRYMYRGTDPDHRENRMLRQVMEEGVALLYLNGLTKGLYMASGALIIGADDAALTFDVALVPLISAATGLSNEAADAAQRKYYLALVKRRATQTIFRSRVLKAYQTRCALCRIGHQELLDAAHIIPDREGGRPVVPNGLSLCKIHHAAYDSDILGIRPDGIAQVRGDVLTETDGPMLRHGLQGSHGQALLVPSRPAWRPDPVGLERRYERFLRAS